MATALGGPPPSTFAASSARAPSPVLPKARLVCFAAAVGPSSSPGSKHLSALSPGGPLRAAASSEMPARGLPAPAAAAESLQAIEEADPEPVEAQIASAVASETPKGEEVFAVVMIGSRQYIVFPGRYIYTQRLKGANVDDKIILNKVLLVGTKKNVYIGEPIVPNAVVHAVVEEQGLDPKVIIFKYKKKKHYRRTIGHRQPNTRIRVTGVTGYQDAPAEPIPE
ncbi:hypothetical protein Taro_022178 [Colocasia esculenta]|uniref:50S ribosomal protein L21, chloroplastic n=1 Tax=Colocasia esculenta TaxID=4460 RepID=A0A843VDQ5_COLES|nr:hypothetical protein [Colocasia esculenta]